MNDPETKRIIAELAALPDYQGWQISHEYPGFYCYSRPGACRVVFFTLEWGHEGMAIEVQVSDGRRVEYESSHFLRSVQLPLPREGRTGQRIFEMVRPTLDVCSSDTGSGSMIGDYNLSTLTARVIAEPQASAAIDLVMNELDEACLDEKLFIVGEWLQEFAASSETRIGVLLSALSITTWVLEAEPGRRAIAARVHALDPERAPKLLEGLMWRR